MKRNCVLPLCLGALFACAPAKPQERTRTTLEDLVRTSLDRNREVLALRQRVAQARGLARQASVHPAPSIEAEGLSGRPLGSPGDQEFSAAFVQPVEAFGKRKNRVRVADSAVALAEAELDERSTQIAYEIETGYLSVVYERERIAVLDRVSDNLRESLRLTEARVREGDAAPLEAQLLAVEQSRTDAQRADATGRLASAELELRRSRWVEGQRSTARHWPSNRWSGGPFGGAVHYPRAREASRPAGCAHSRTAGRSGIGACQIGGASRCDRFGPIHSPPGKL